MVSSGPGKSGGRFRFGFGDWFQAGEGTRGWKTNHGSRRGVHCGAWCAGAPGRNGGKRSAALRWSALTRPVARASGATVERATLHGLPAAPYEFAIAHRSAANCKSRSVVNTDAVVHACLPPPTRALKLYSILLMEICRGGGDSKRSVNDPDSRA